jgi:hypothetical protein
VFFVFKDFWRPHFVVAHPCSFGGLVKVGKDLNIPIAQGRALHVSWGGVEEDWPDPHDPIPGVTRTYTAADYHGVGDHTERLYIDGEYDDVVVFYKISCNKG